MDIILSWYLEAYSSTTQPPAITIVKLHLKIHYFIIKLQKKKLGKHSETKMKDEFFLRQMIGNNIHD